MTTNPTSIRFNEEESMTHEWLKDFFGFRGLHGEDSQTIKQAERTCMNVLQRLFGDELKELFKRRSRDDLLKNRAIQMDKLNKCNTFKR